MSALIRLGVVDAHPLFRGGVVETLEASGDCAVVAEGAGQAEAVRIAVECAPDVMLLDLHSEFSIEAVRRLASEFRFMRTIILTGIANEDQVVATLQAGAAGYILKGVSGPELVESIRRVHRGECYVSPALAAKLILNPRSQTLDRFSTLAVREEQILTLLTEGLTNKEIARRLALCEKTVKHYASLVFGKLGVRNRVEAAILGHSRHRRRL